MASSTPSTPPSVPAPTNDGEAASSSGTVYVTDASHPIFKHFETALNADGKTTENRRCCYCGHTFNGGMTRCAQHLAEWNKLRRRDVTLCTAVTQDVRDGVKALYEARIREREGKREAEEQALSAVNGCGSGKKGRITNFFGDESACRKKEADRALCLLFAGLRLPEHHADHVLFRNAVSAIARAGTSYVPPKRKYIGGAGLRDCRTSIEAALVPISSSWRRSGVTIASDMMTDQNGRPIANVLLINDSGAVFTDAVDTNMEMKTGGYIAGILRPIIQRVGPENVVAFCMDGGSNYAAACRILIAEHPHIEHVPCATHVLDLLMEDIGRMAWAKEVVEKANIITSFVRKHHLTRNYMRSDKVEGGKGKQVLKPAGTRFGTQFISVSRLCEVRMSLTQLVLSEEWARFADGGRKPGSEAFSAAILDSDWWTKALQFVNLMRLPFMAMRATDSSAKGMMGRMYDLMLQLTVDVDEKLEEARLEGLTAADANAIRRMVKRRWDGSMACPLHVVGRILNPANQEEGIFPSDMECTRVFKAFIARHYEDKEFMRDGEPIRATLVMQDGLDAFITLKGSFGLPTAIADRAAVKEGRQSMARWWQWHGSDYPELAALACRVLSQPVSAAACERNWAVWEAVHTAKRNRLGAEKCRDLVYVSHNWHQVHNWHKEDGGSLVLPGCSSEAPVPTGYNLEDDLEEEEGEDLVMEDEYQ
ncbi:hypothetical protein CLOM_g14368 [Closterium sp. NIES-68]|nr:hypothetical protein CLOM_g14368 [Closterium sp. NIES-68]GJP73132.1 hypothetical protein CLOP_g3873 [Closterium sp. NIES-67]GJP84251.1 hypothetical protein CLOP_g14329 [Closterium sp. NIES-67]